MEPERKPLPPYLPYRTFGTFLDHIAAIGVPSHIDKSVMTQFSGAMQSWLKSGLRYMKLIGTDDVPDARLAKLARAKGDERKALLAELFKSSYSFLDGKIDLAKTTPQKLKDAVSALGANGDTVEKIIAFMVAMAKEANIQVSPLLTQRAPSVRRPRTKTAKPGEGDTRGTENITRDDVHDQMGEMKSIRLGNGSLVLSGSFNVFDASPEERGFVFELIDKMVDFEKKRGDAE